MKLIKTMAVSLTMLFGAVQAQNISIATGGTGGVYYPMGGGLASVLSKHVPGMSATANVNPKAIADLAAHWRESNADERQADLDKLRSIFAQYQMIAGMKTAVAHYSKDPDWLRVRPPLMQLTSDQQAKLISELQKANFSMPGL